MKFLYDLEPKDTDTHVITNDTLIYDAGAVCVDREGALKNIFLKLKFNT